MQLRNYKLQIIKIVQKKINGKLQQEQNDNKNVIEEKKKKLLENNSEQDFIRDKEKLNVKKAKLYVANQIDPDQDKDFLMMQDILQKHQHANQKMFERINNNTKNQNLQEQQSKNTSLNSSRNQFSSGYGKINQDELDKFKQNLQKPNKIKFFKNRLSKSDREHQQIELESNQSDGIKTKRSENNKHKQEIQIQQLQENSQQSHIQNDNDINEIKKQKMERPKQIIQEGIIYEEQEQEIEQDEEYVNEKGEKKIKKVLKKLKVFVALKEKPILSDKLLTSKMVDIKDITEEEIKEGKYTQDEIDEFNKIQKYKKELFEYEFAAQQVQKQQNSYLNQKTESSQEEVEIQKIIVDKNGKKKLVTTKHKITKKINFENPSQLSSKQTKSQKTWKNLENSVSDFSTDEVQKHKQVQKNSLKSQLKLKRLQSKKKFAKKAENEEKEEEQEGNEEEEDSDSDSIDNQNLEIYGNLNEDQKEIFEEIYENIENLTDKEVKELEDKGIDVTSIRNNKYFNLKRKINKPKNPSYSLTKEELEFKQRKQREKLEKLEKQRKLREEAAEKKRLQEEEQRRESELLNQKLQQFKNNNTMEEMKKIQQQGLNLTQIKQEINKLIKLLQEKKDYELEFNIKNYQNRQEQLNEQESLLNYYQVERWQSNNKETVKYILFHQHVDEFPNNHEDLKFYENLHVPQASSGLLKDLKGKNISEDQLKQILKLQTINNDSQKIYERFLLFQQDSEFLNKLKKIAQGLEQNTVEQKTLEKGQNQHNKLVQQEIQNQQITEQLTDDEQNESQMNYKLNQYTTQTITDHTAFQSQKLSQKWKNETKNNYSQIQEKQLQRYRSQNSKGQFDSFLNYSKEIPSKKLTQNSEITAISKIKCDNSFPSSTNINSEKQNENNKIVIQPQFLGYTKNKAEIMKQFVIKQQYYQQQKQNGSFFSFDNNSYINIDNQKSLQSSKNSSQILEKLIHNKQSQFNKYQDFVKE
ncbi:hypothetical protein PPERSA_04314 [Pseudocohnilembus persalinus]|uniref:Uncharacterized protein n=1 Tax=Pseudocohnilembus persalinus TaxID=266149 RepID=A0A0V0QQ91_PSEPJ|nr:hypothetical protein PPERSA_04314 [Pseudocohnilembus persalinus]|eukprot:KRX04499.1 hypothetical protein PPERSA_04314 [Pseudocohnilembus persalinus]